MYCAVCYLQTETASVLCWFCCVFYGCFLCKDYIELLYIFSIEAEMENVLELCVRVCVRTGGRERERERKGTFMHH